jgi:hypothetical protein
MNDHDDFTSQLTRSLTDHSDTMVGSHLGLADVKGKARSIRRRRATGAMVAVAAAVAIIVPTIDLAGHTGGKPEPAPATQVTQAPSPTTPTQTASADDGTQPPTGILDVRDLPTGPAPAIEYVDGGALHLPGTTDAAKAGTRYAPNQFVQMDDGARVWLTSHQGDFYVEIQDADGSFRAPQPSGMSLDVNEQHNVAAWLDRSGRVIVWEDRLHDPAPYGDPLPAGSEPSIAGVTGERCDLACTVTVNTAGPAGWQPYEVGVDGTRKLTDGSFRIVDDVSASGLTGGRTSLTDQGSCTKVLGGGDFPGWGTCDFQVERFAPDDSAIAAYPPYVEGFGSTGLAILDTTGSVRWDRHSTVKSQATVLSVAWEDPSHLLATVFQGGSWSVVRFGIDGHMEYAVPPASGTDLENPFVLPVRPISGS